MSGIRAVNIEKKSYLVTVERPLGLKSEDALACRRFAIGDIHGCSKTFRKMVEEVVCLTPEDTLYLLGDYIDRGPDSRGVLDYLMHLSQSGFDIQPLRGNHEEMLLNSIADPVIRRIWYLNGGWDTIREFGVDSPAEIPQHYLEFIDHLRNIHITEDYVLVHAGLDFSTCNPLQDTSPHYMLWSRDYRVDSDKIGSRTLVTGHTVKPLSDIRKSLSTDHIYLDNGCFSKAENSYGSLVALDMDNRKLLVQKNIE